MAALVHSQREVWKSQSENTPVLSAMMIVIRLNPVDAAQLAIVKQMSLQGSRSSDGNCHADEPAGITQLSRP